jgi:hypothetical protein
MKLRDYLLFQLLKHTGATGGESDVHFDLFQQARRWQVALKVRSPRRA